jgi:superfamily II DNA/RNA helicase
MVDTKGEDKLMVLDGIIQEMHKKVTKTMIFCNTIDSCRAVAYFLDAQTTNNPCLSYHGEINSKDRARNMELFRSDPCGEPMFMVCSDIAARGLDIPGVDHVLMFDFPLNPVDYLHRTGRTGRLGQGGKGIVTAIVAKRDRVLAQAIEGAIARNKPLDSLTSHKRDYQDKGKLAAIVGRRDQEDYYHGKDLERRKDGPRITLKRRSTKRCVFRCLTLDYLLHKSNKCVCDCCGFVRLVSDPNRHGIHVRQPAQKTVSRTVAKRIAEINQRRGEQLVRKRKKDLADKKKKSSKF